MGPINVFPVGYVMLDPLNALTAAAAARWADNRAERLFCCTVIADWPTHVAPTQQRPSLRIIPIWVTTADGVSVNVVPEHTVGLSSTDSSNHQT